MPERSTAAPVTMGDAPDVPENFFVYEEFSHSTENRSPYPVVTILWSPSDCELVLLPWEENPALYLDTFSPAATITAPESTELIGGFRSIGLASNQPPSKVDLALNLPSKPGSSREQYPFPAAAITMRPLL